MNCCQLCNSSEEVSLIEPEFIPIVQKMICEISVKNQLEICIECQIFLYQVKVFIKKVAETMKQNMIEEQQPEERQPEDEPVKTNQEIVYEEDVLEEETNSILDPAEEFEIEDKKISTSEADEDEKLFVFKCHMCNEPEFSKMFQLSAHTRSKHDCLPLVKCFCDKMLSTLRGLQRHRAKHFPRFSDIRCSQCPMNFKTQKGLENHFEKRHGPNKEKFICSQCGQNFVNAKVLERHEVTHELPPELRRKYECKDCGKMFISSDARRDHIAKHHEKIYAFFCDVCSKSFYTRKSLLSHSVSHKPNESIACDLCNGTFKTEKHMQKHRKTHFPPALGEFFVCEICLKEFRKKSQIKLHMLIHSEIAEHKCNICEKSFKKKAYLKSHMVTHTGEKKFSCMFCPRSFSDSGNCRKHKLREHPEEIAEHEAKYGKKGVANVLYLDIQ